MKNRINLFLKINLIVFVFIAVTSCEDRVQVDIDAKSKLLCVDAFLTNLRQNLKVRLTYTDSYFSGKTPPPLTGATVIIKDLTLNKTINLIDNSNGEYVYNLLSTDTIIYTNHTYELNIKYNNYEYKATSACKRASKIDSLYFEYKEESVLFGQTAKAGYRLGLIAADVPGLESNFYWIKIFKNGKFYGRPENIQLEFFGNSSEFDGLLFYPEKWSTSGPDGPVDPCVTGDIARLEIHGITRETYDFLFLGQQMSASGGLFATTPVNLNTNIVPLETSYPKAVGFFSVSDVNFQEKVCP